MVRLVRQEGEYLVQPQVDTGHMETCLPRRQIEFVEVEEDISISCHLHHHERHYEGIDVVENTRANSMEHTCHQVMHGDTKTADGKSFIVL